MFTVVAWYRHEDLSGDGSDTRSFVWESTPGYSLAFGVREEEGRHDAEWWFQTASHASISDASGPPIEQGQWVHVAMVAGGGTVKAFVDGVNVGSYTDSTLATTYTLDGLWTVGGSLNNGTAAS